MVKITIAGGSGPPSDETIPLEVRWRAVNYNDTNDLVEALRGTHTLLSFVQLLSDPGQQAQRNLIDASIIAGVKRFAPSEYGSVGTRHMPWWDGKEEIRKYLRAVNKDKKVLEYTLFQPGLFLDYLASPYKTSKYVDPLDTVFDFQNRRAIVVDGHEDAVMTLTAVADLAAAVARAVEHDGQWPEASGIRGNRVTFADVVEIGEKIRGPFAVEKVKLHDLEAGVLKTPWTLVKKHGAVDEEQYMDFTTAVPIGVMLSSIEGAWDVSDEFNQLFPDYEFEKANAFLSKVWEGKP
ncbi:hypothetical protein CCHL11_03385 [Colletotrichum chlorophyti]|uniref:NmrA-like domain-containing protein n=1 Tax=Colletotrichum chlorophyti TaxID=708187 RepID=A0A1Q8S043_9PEZI|nr:hypothetical protein CCHL11_03385 [Colletotrichum chlorophyti]